jgi:hypothetical protein
MVAVAPPANLMVGAAEGRRTGLIHPHKRNDGSAD